jgi:hypothetical protein
MLNRKTRIIASMSAKSVMSCPVSSLYSLNTGGTAWFTCDTPKSPIRTDYTMELKKDGITLLPIEISLR